MTLPYERTAATLRVRDFLIRLASPYGGGIKGVRTEVRQEARRLLKHFPTPVDLLKASRHGDVFGEPKVTE